MTAAVEIAVSFGSAYSGQNPTRFYGDFARNYFGERNLAKFAELRLNLEAIFPMSLMSTLVLLRKISDEL